jgi:hypothetical protein
LVFDDADVAGNHAAAATSTSPVPPTTTAAADYKHAHNTR